MIELRNDQDTDNRKPWLESEFTQHIQSGHLSFPPVEFHYATANYERGANYDGILEADWGQERARYVFEYKANNFPRTLETVQWQMRAVADREKLLPLIIVPYLSEEALTKLEANEISGIDLCGNGVLLSPHFRIWRTGYANRFKDTRPIRNPYRGDGSIFARCFLLRSFYKSLGELQEFAHERTFAQDGSRIVGSLALSTASKIVQSLADELILKKEGNTIRLIDAPRLLLFLRRGYNQSARTELVGKTPFSDAVIWEMLAENENRNGLRSVATGNASAGHYRVLSGTETVSLYVDDIKRASEILAVRATRAFANIQILEDRKNSVYFDARTEGNIRWASPIQTWLELANGGPREQEAADELERLLLNGRGEIL